tara:strand:- start:127 stop:615 length:489 start_codon:yes stop_codon:yes gene_type:complete
MNIFYLDPDPKVCAEMHCDKHCVKMILETAQMLCTAHRVLDGDEYADSVGLYKTAFKNHPSAVWIRSSYDNYNYAYNLFCELCEEFEKRYAKNHKCSDLIMLLLPTPTNITFESFSEPPQCMPDQYKCENSVKAYRNYYLGEKMGFAKWNYTEVPSWAVELK